MTRSFLPLVLGLVCALAGAPAASADSRPDDHAPIGVMGEHVHDQGEFMASFRYMRMSMEGNLDGSSSQSSGDIFADGFLVAPRNMSMDMYMLGGMYGLTDNLTLMAMVPVLVSAMDHRTLTGVEFTTRSSGLADIRLAALYQFYQQEGRQAIFSLGLSLPTGSTTEKGDTPAGRVRLPYPMQLGSGSPGLEPGLTFTSQHDDWSWGAQGKAMIWLNRNTHDYSLGNRGALTGWLSRRLAHGLSGSLRLDGQGWGNINGRDDRIGMIAPTGDPNRRAGFRLDALAGLNYAFDSRAPGHRLALEFGVPVYQNLDGPQLRTRWILVLGWQKAFD